MTSVEFIRVYVSHNMYAYIRTCIVGESGSSGIGIEIIAGAAAGGVAVILILIIIIGCVVYRKRRGTYVLILVHMHKYTCKHTYTHIYTRMHTCTHTCVH